MFKDISRARSGLELDSGKRHEANGHQADDDEGDSQSPKRSRNVRVVKALTNRSESDDSDGEAEAGARSEDRALRQGVFALHHEERAAENRAVDGNQRQKHAQRAVETWAEPFNDHLDDLHDRRDRSDEDQEGQKTNIDVFRAGKPRRKGSFGEEIFVENVVERAGQRENDHHCGAHTDRVEHVLGNG